MHSLLTQTPAGSAAHAVSDPSVKALPAEDALMIPGYHVTVR